MSHNLQDVLRTTARDRDESEPLEPQVARLVRQILAEIDQPQRPSIANELTDVLTVSVADRTSHCSASASSDASSRAPSAEPEEQLSAPTLPRESICELTEVLNSASGIVHRVVCGPPALQSDSWLTACSWRFGMSGRAAVPSGDHRRCRRCFPESRCFPA